LANQLASALQLQDGGRSWLYSAKDVRGTWPAQHHAFEATADDLGFGFEQGVWGVHFEHWHQEHVLEAGLRDGSFGHGVSLDEWC
jgi:lipopolysaccharide biosynthesis glycosyltransferase